MDQSISSRVSEILVYTSILSKKYSYVKLVFDFRYLRKRKTQKLRAQVTQVPNNLPTDIPVTTQYSIEEALTKLQLLASCCHRFANDSKALADMVLQMSKAFGTAKSKSVSDRY